MTLMGETFMNGFSDRGSIPLTSIKRRFTQSVSRFLIDEESNVARKQGCQWHACGGIPLTSITK
ncbi:protein of unknown function [Petrocella atlantisensis]|uniref:Uncharacterized protein n=1 Tax=Petrocella atlantisensis TaxID=2173034 RepID=A0A3P7S2A6_9FIRM|nr:protein of unknown function [Petrocella atlantisensis]